MDLERVREVLSHIAQSAPNAMVSFEMLTEIRQCLATHGIGIRSVPVVSAGMHRITALVFPFRTLTQEELRFAEILHLLREPEMDAAEAMEGLLQLANDPTSMRISDELLRQFRTALKPLGVTIHSVPDIPQGTHRITSIEKPFRHPTVAEKKFHEALFGKPETNDEGFKRDGSHVIP